MIYNDASYDFSTPELPQKLQFSASDLLERSQFGQNDRFRLDYSAILDKSNEDNYEIETASASTSKPNKVTVKKRSLSMSSVKNKRQRGITSLLQLSDSEDGEGNCCLCYGHMYSPSNSC